MIRKPRTGPNLAAFAKFVPQPTRSLPAPLHKLDRDSPAHHGRGPLQTRQRDVVSRIQ